MNETNKIKTKQKLEKELFKYDDKDLINILIENKDLIEEFYSMTSLQIDENLKNISHERIKELLFNNLLNFEIEKNLKNLKKYEVKKIVKDNFPKEQPRELQLETISKIYDAIEEGYKYIILEAVSGFGKSLIATALANIYSNDKTYILTTTNQLANQYITEFNKYKITKLNSRSTCNCKKTNSYCSAYKCIYSKCPYFKYSDFNNDFASQLSCEYLYQLKEGLKSKTNICTYDYFLGENFYHSDYIKPRKLLICDEGHNIDDKLSNALALKITAKQFRDEMKIDMNREYKYISQNEDYHYYLLKFKKIYENKLEKMTEGSSKYNRFKKRLDDINRFMKYFDKSNANLIFERDNYKNWIFKPIKFNKMIDDSLLKFGDVCIFMSSSIFDHENFAYDLGIDENEIYSIRVPNTFDSSKNPIKIYTEFEMSGENIKKGIAKETLRTIKQILKTHSTEKGVIHTTNHDCANYIKRHIDNYRIITHNSKNREQVLEEFKKSKQPLVLLSPSMNEGVDLPGELCRFQIIFKLPYLPYDDQWISKRKQVYEDGNEWYRYKMLTKLIQCYGRGIRFEGDYCKTYILDNRLFDVINDDLEGNEIIPKYFIEAIENLQKQ